MTAGDERALGGRARPAGLRSAVDASAPSDEECVERARRGDHDAFRILVERHQGRVHRLARRWLRDDDAARDVTQEAFLKAYRALDRFEGRSRFTTWLHRLTVNQCLDWRRREQARPPFAGSGEDDPDGVERQPSPAREADPERALDRSDLREGIDRALGALPDDARQTLVLREVDGLSYAEIAEVLGIPKGTVMSRLHHARRRLRDELERLGWTPDAADDADDGESQA